MRRVARAALLLLSALVACGAASAQKDDGGGRDVSVALFTTHAVGAVKVTVLDGAGWTAACARCAHLAGNQVTTVGGAAGGAKELYGGGQLEVRELATGETRTASGLWHVRATTSHQVDVVLTLPSERYVAAVLSAEAAAAEPAQSLEALAIVARTFALNGRHYHAAAGHLQADLCDSTACQALRPGAVSAAVSEAVRATAGETLWFGPARAQVFFSQHCGGLTEDGGSLSPKLAGLPYLRSQPDVFCVRQGRAVWHAEVAPTELAAVAKLEGWRLPAKIATIVVTRRDSAQRATLLSVTGVDGTVAQLSASSLRLGIGRALGWNRVRSDWYRLGLRQGVLVFDGQGHGHGVGLCQAGATEMARQGRSAREILGLYFARAKVGIGSGDDGWRTEKVGALTLRATQPMGVARAAEVLRTWTHAEALLAPRIPVTAELTFAPTTELFRQLSGEPGWALAATRANRIVLEPEAVFRAHGRSMTGTLLHEMLHVLVESEASAHAPLWLREGLVESLAGEAVTGAVTHTAAEIDAALLHAKTQAEGSVAHREAAMLVKGAIGRYGASAVRGWLRSGVPAVGP